MDYTLYTRRFGQDLSFDRPNCTNALRDNHLDCLAYAIADFEADAKILNKFIVTDDSQIGAGR